MGLLNIKVMCEQARGFNGTFANKSCVNRREVLMGLLQIIVLCEQA